MHLCHTTARILYSSMKDKWRFSFTEKDDIIFNEKCYFLDVMSLKSSTWLSFCNEKNNYLFFLNEKLDILKYNQFKQGNEKGKI